MIKFCSLASGSSGNCQYIETDNIRILVDAGLSGKRIANGLDSIGVDPNSIDYIFVTHEHKDHVKGVGILSRRYNLPIYANQNTWDAMREDLGKLEDENILVFETNNKFKLRDLKIFPFEISHDAVEPVGYCFCHNGIKLSIVTDLGYASEKVKENIKNSHLLLIESNHDVEMLRVGRYPWFLKKRVLGEYGHLSNDAAGELICEVLSGNKEKILLGHLSNENNFPKLAYQTVANIIAEKGINIDEDVTLDMTFRDKPGKLYKFG